MVYAKDVFTKFLKGFKRTAVFAITTRCNCKCLMCDMYRQPSKTVSIEGAKEILDFLSKNKFLIVYFTGGEPTLHPNVVEIVEYANKLGLVTAMTTNGTASKETVTKLKDAGLYLLTVSFDHWDPSVCEKIRRHTGIKAKQESVIKHCREVGLRTHTLTFLNSHVLMNGVEEMVRYVNEKLGVPFGFCYPVKTNNRAYSLGYNLSEDYFSYKNLESSLKTLLSLKRMGYAIANLGTYIEDTIRFHENKYPNFCCKGGEDVIYIDWSGNVYPCFVKEKLFSILNGEEARFLKGVECNDCLTNCFREPSILSKLPFSPLLIKEVLYSHSVRALFI